MTTKAKLISVAVLASTAFGALNVATAASARDGDAYSVDVEPNQTQRLQGRSVHMSARITSHRDQTISSYVMVTTHPGTWLYASPNSADFTAGEARTIPYSAHHAGIRRALRHGHSSAAKLVVWAPGEPGVRGDSQSTVVRFRISPP